MARFETPTPEHEQAWAEWLALAEHAPVREVASRFDPWSLYWLKTAKQRVTVASIDCEPGGKITCTINVLARFNLLHFERQVFGIDPNDLEPCDLPEPGEPLGAALSQDEVNASLASARAIGMSGLRTRDRLCADLRLCGMAARDPNVAALYRAFAERAKTGEFDDYADTYNCPITQLHTELMAAGLRAFARRVAEGEFDASKAESDEWMRSPDGQATLALLSEDTRIQLYGVDPLAHEPTKH